MLISLPSILLHKITCPKLSQHQTWHTYVQESICTVASASGINLVLQDGLVIDEVTKEEFEILKEGEMIWAADQHSCPECTHQYKGTSDVIPGGDLAAIVGVDENTPVLAYEGDRTLESQGQEQNTTGNLQSPQDGDNMDIDYSPVKLVVMDGIVMGPNHCAYEDCTSQLANSCGGAFCALHESEYGAKCRIHGCTNQKVVMTQACPQHQEQWKKHTEKHNRHTFSGIQRILQRPNENMPWTAPITENVQPHDEPAPEPQRTNYFTAPRFYCVETICAPCGVVIAWAKFAKLESPTNILAFLEKVYPTEES
ncbi:hypothetical protein L208DRAFT_1295974 [Tricholoma matsutake]|nr:hypothetical protein L208DRAFT_1295974 [Tricholoma matsutake 945]